MRIGVERFETCQGNALALCSAAAGRVQTQDEMLERYMCFWASPGTQVKYRIRATPKSRTSFAVAGGSHGMADAKMQNVECRQRCEELVLMERDRREENGECRARTTHVVRGFRYAISQKDELIPESGVLSCVRTDAPLLARRHRGSDPSPSWVGCIRCLFSCHPGSNR